MRRLALLLAPLPLIAAASAVAEVVAAGEAGMETRSTVQVAAPPARVWALLARPARWWDPAHSWSGKAVNLSLDPRPGGCLCERLANGGGVEHLRVVYAAPGSLLRLVGALGPFQGEAVQGVLTFALEPAASGTRLTVTYRLGGYRPGGFAAVAPGVEQVLAGQAARLKAEAENR